MVIGFGLEPELVERVRAVDPTLDVQVLGEQPRQAWTGRALYPSEIQARTPAGELEAALPTAEVLLAFWSADLARLLGSAEGARRFAPGLRWVQLTHAGSERVDRSLIESGVTFTTATGLAAGPIAEFVLTYMLMCSKGWPALFHQQREHRYDRYLPRELRDRTVGVIGMGEIGREVARLAKAFGCRVVAIRRSYTERGSDPPADLALPPEALHELLELSDFAVVAAPATEQTRHMIGAAELRALGPDGYLVNIARGSLVDEQALIAALRDGVIAGAGLDVFEQEPLPPESPLWDMEHVILSPHISGGTTRYNELATAIFCDNLRRYLAGEPLASVVDVDRGY